MTFARCLANSTQCFQMSVRFCYDIIYFLLEPTDWGILDKKTVEVEFEFGPVIGKGGFSKIHCIKSKQDKKQYALKLVPKKSLDVENEILAYKQIDSPFFAKFYGHFLLENKKQEQALVLEYIIGVNMLKLVSSPVCFIETNS